MREDDARSMLQQIEKRIRASDIEIEHRDLLIRLRSLIEEDLTNSSQAERERLDPGKSTARTA